MRGTRRVGILGVGLVPFDRYEDVPVESIARPAVIAALKDAGIERTEVDAAFVSHLYQGEVLRQRILKGLRFPEITVTNVNEVPSITSAAAVDAAENQTDVLTVTSDDPDTPDAGE